MLQEYLYEAPRSLDELYAVLDGVDDGDTVIKFLAGGTDLVPRLNLVRQDVPKADEKPMLLVYLGLLGLDTIAESGGVVSIGACCTLNDVMNHPVVREKLPALSETIHEMAGHTIRNTGTIGGNIMNASPAADSLPTLFVLDAELVLLSKEGSRTVNVNEFFTGPGRTVAGPKEILSEIRIKADAGKAAFIKLGRRRAETLSVVNSAAYVLVEEDVCKIARVAVGSSGPTVLRCPAVEAELQGKPIDTGLIKEASAKVADVITPITDLRSSAWYRNRVAPVIVSRAIEAASNRGEG